jgi:hypothetical protein
MVRTVVGLVVIVSTLQISRADEQSCGELQKPESWQLFVQFRSQARFPGTWLSEGKTQALWAGVPYRQIETCQGSHGGNGFVDTHKMETAEGRVLSRGTAHLFWDEISSQVKGLASGFDDGKPYSGTLTLIGIDQSAGVERWAYQETSRGTTADYIIERVLKDSSHRTTICTSTEKKYVWEVKSHRRNPVAEHFNEFDLIGVWETELGRFDSRSVAEYVDTGRSRCSGSKRQDRRQWTENSTKHACNVLGCSKRSTCLSPKARFTKPSRQNRPELIFGELNSVTHRSTAVG